MRTRVILLVDQDASVAEAIALALGQTEFQFLFAPDYKDAMRLLAERGNDVDLVVTDLEPRGPALALMTAIRTFREDLPFIVLTSLADPAIHAEALRRGAAKLLRKPIDFHELRTMVLGLRETAMPQRAVAAAASPRSVATKPTEPATAPVA